MRFAFSSKLSVQVLSSFFFTIPVLQVYLVFLLARMVPELHCSYVAQEKSSKVADNWDSVRKTSIFLIISTKKTFGALP